MIKHIILCGFLVGFEAFAEQSTCPSLSVQGTCTDGVWHISLSQPGDSWVITSEDINGMPCSNESENLSLIRWNYAAEFARLASIFCHYSLLDEDHNEISEIQLKSHDFRRTGSAWYNDGYPGYYKCDASFVECLLTPK